MVHCSDIEKAATDYMSDYGVLGVGYGGKETGGTLDCDVSCLTFFVERKLPMKGQDSRLEDGRRVLPSVLNLQDTTIGTDVVALTDANLASVGMQTNKKIMTPGGKLQAGNDFGTMACLVERSDGVSYALTNQHVPKTVGTWVYFKRNSLAILRRRASELFLYEPDEVFLGFEDNPNTDIRVDAALVSVDDTQLHLFKNQIPHFGAVESIFDSSAESLDEYKAKLVGKDVYSYSWKSKKRFGRISHVFCAFPQNGQGNIIACCFLVRGKNGVQPGLAGDSGKIWMTEVDGENAIIGLHFGELIDNLGEFGNQGVRYATVTDFHLLSEHLEFELSDTGSDQQDS